MKKIGLLLGSFDPIHIAHINIAACVLNAKLCDKVLFVVAKHNPWKDYEPTPFKVRCDMISASLSAFHGACEVCTMEKEIEPPTYSYKVLTKIREKYSEDELYILCGSDTMEKIHLWKNYKESIEPYFKIISIERGSEVSEKGTMGLPFLINNTNEKIKGIAPLTMVVSSTVIRNMVKNGMNPYPYVTKEVLDVIEENKLYKN